MHVLVLNTWFLTPAEISLICKNLIIVRCINWVCFGLWCILKFPISGHHHTSRAVTVFTWKTLIWCLPRIETWGNVLSLKAKPNWSRQRGDFHCYCFVIWHLRAKVKGTKGDTCVGVITLHTSKGRGRSRIRGPHFPPTHIQTKPSSLILMGQASFPASNRIVFTSRAAACDHLTFINHTRQPQPWY